MIFLYLLINFIISSPLKYEPSKVYLSIMHVNPENGVIKIGLKINGGSSGVYNIENIMPNITILDRNKMWFVSEPNGTFFQYSNELSFARLEEKVGAGNNITQPLYPSSQYPSTRLLSISHSPIILNIAPFEDKYIGYFRCRWLPNSIDGDVSQIVLSTSDNDLSLDTLICGNTNYYILQLVERLEGISLVKGR